MPAFHGYSPDTFHFLTALALNNNRPWFEEHRQDYERHILEPSLALIADLEPVIKGISPHYTAVPKKMGGSLMRLYRDTRFSRDKTPYKTNVGIQFRHERAGDVHAPAFYLHLATDECFTGAGSWRPESEPLLAYRTWLANHPEDYHAALARAEAGGLPRWGEFLVRVPRGFPADHPQAEALRLKDHLVSGPLDPALYLSRDLLDVLRERFIAAGPFMGFLCRALSLAF